VRDAIRKAKLQRDVLRQHASPATPTLRARQDAAKSSADARYKVVAKKRALGLDELDMDKEKEEEEEVEAEGQKVFHLLDLVSDIPDSDPAPEVSFNQSFLYSDSAVYSNIHPSINHSYVSSFHLKYIFLHSFLFFLLCLPSSKLSFLPSFRFYLLSNLHSFLSFFLVLISNNPFLPLHPSLIFHPSGFTFF
jgi:hypothetical protein